MIPMRAWVSANAARSDATRKSHASATSKPPVMATPFTAPMSGVSIGGTGPRPAVVSPAAPVSPSAAPSVAASSFRSSPAQKAGSAPVSTMAATESSASSSPMVCQSALRSSVLRALRACGRFRVTVATASLRSTRITGSGTGASVQGVSW